MKSFSSYLREREQFVDVHGILGAKKSVRCGVPQDSILGPLLFTLYINDMSTAVNYDLYLYANISMLQITGKDVKQIEKKIWKSK